ncbi:unnamed protein product [Symbiodinium natans]|uniref:Uncharacterized protein n=1 Tax=Symbiodinium natans TaxID=878477 RepID=A0A812SVS5_9DINO|nr:unnamed protein product [Symbiodinium natans]
MGLTWDIKPVNGENSCTNTRAPKARLSSTGAMAWLVDVWTSHSLFALSLLFASLMPAEARLAVKSYGILMASTAMDDFLQHILARPPLYKLRQTCEAHVNAQNRSGSHLGRYTSLSVIISSLYMGHPLFHEETRVVALTETCTRSPAWSIQ